MGFSKPKKVILCLGGGGARGLSNIGVLKVLERHFGREDMPFDAVVGTSIGSLIGAAYCLGITPEDLEVMAQRFAWPDIVDVGLHYTGLIQGNKFEKIIAEITEGRGFRDMQIPFSLTATDIETGEEVVYSSGDLVKLVRASCSWPGIFAAVETDGRMLVDGGLRNSVPTKTALASGGSFLIAVNPGFAVKGQKVNNVLKALIQSVQIMGSELNRYQSEVADITIIPELHGIDQFDFSRAAEIIKYGEAAAEKNMKRLKNKLKYHW